MHDDLVCSALISFEFSPHPYIAKLVRKGAHNPVANAPALL